MCINWFWYISEKWGSVECSTNGPEDALELNIQLYTKEDGLAKEPGWCISLDAPQMDMWMHMDTVVNHFGCSADGHADTQWLCLMLLLHMDSVDVIVIIVKS